MIGAAVLVVFVGCPQLHESLDMGIHAPASDLVATGLGEIGFAEAAEHRAGDHHRSAQRSALAHEFRALHVLALDGIRLEGVLALFVPRHLHAHFLQEVDEVLDVEDFRHVADAHRVACQQHGAEYLQCFVLGTLGSDGSAEAMPAFDYECSHVICGLLPDGV